MKKIKSVRLKNDYRTNDWVIQQKTVGSYNLLNEVYYFEGDFGIKGFFVKDILNNKTDLFEIEYEEERKYIDVRIEFENDEYDNSWKPAMIRDIERTLNNNFIMTKKFKITELAEGTK